MGISQSSRRRGFTLVELLVVIGIIALLIAILLPVLHKVRESGNRTKCLSNLRQLGLSMIMYADQWNGNMPLGYWSGQKQSNFLINYNENSVTFPTILGALWKNDMMRAPEALYCPSESHDKWQYASGNNPWPPEETPSVANRSTRCGYGVRPTLNWREDGIWPDTMSRLIKFKNRALIADLVATPFFLERRHVKGVNVFYADGSTRWVDRKYIDPFLAPIPDLIDALDPSYNDNMQNESVTPFTGVWPTFDKPAVGG